MKTQIIPLLLAALLLVGCGSPMAQADAGAERMMDAVESAAMNLPAVTETTAAPLTKEEAQAIALQHAGFTADQVTRLRTEYEIDDGIPRFEVTFRQGRWEYDYEINADTGTILSFDRDD